MSVVEKVKSEVAQICAVGADEINKNALLIQYGLDSIRSMELIVALEDHFDIEVQDEDLARITTVEEVATLIEQELSLN
jgi:acyl carrier protein